MSCSFPVIHGMFLMGLLVPNPHFNQEPMKTILLVLCLMVCTAGPAQEDTTIIQPVSDTSVIQKDTLPAPDTLPVLLPKSLFNTYGDLLNDDPVYNKRSSWVI